MCHLVGNFNLRFWKSVKSNLATAQILTAPMGIGPARQIEQGRAFLGRFFHAASGRRVHLIDQTGSTMDVLQQKTEYKSYCYISHWKSNILNKSEVSQHDFIIDITMISDILPHFVNYPNVSPHTLHFTIRVTIKSLIAQHYELSKHYSFG